MTDPVDYTRDTPPTGRRVRFDPTVNLGHMVTASVFLASAGIAWATVTARIDVNTREIARVEMQNKEALDRAERRLATDQQRDREAFIEIKLLLREIDKKLDMKMDKGR